MKQDPAVITTKLSRSYGEIKALKELDLTIFRGEIFGLVGPDGAGKTTAFRLLCGVIPPDSGEIEIAGLNLLKNPDAVSERIGYMPQRFSLYEDLTVEENLSFYGDVFCVPKDQYRKKLTRLMEFSRLSPFLKRRAGALSGGMKQKLALSCALIHDPDILFLDEPTTGVDALSRRELWKILSDLNAEGMTIIVSTPYMDEVEMTTRMGFLYKGRLLKQGSPFEILETMRGFFIEITADKPFQAVEALSDEPGIQSCYLMGDHINIRSSIEYPEDKISALLSEKGVVLKEYRPGRPAMEDVFIDIVRKEETYAGRGD
ncbi:MAG: ABC transporter ATP-binding protein [Chloroflexi bacterium]|nr:ABC transporter ATP-binding protein [Chloroflexota bacterium]